MIHRTPSDRCGRNRHLRSLAGVAGLCLSLAIALAGAARAQQPDATNAPAKKSGSRYPYRNMAPDSPYKLWGGTGGAKQAPEATPADADAVTSPAAPSAATPAGKASAPPAAGASQQLFLYALDYENNPVAGVGMRSLVSGGARDPQETGDDGSAQVGGAARGEVVRARVDDSDWVSYDGWQEGAIGGRALLFRVFSRNVATLPAEQRLAEFRERMRVALEMRSRPEPPPQPGPESGEAGVAKPVAGMPMDPVLADPIWGSDLNRFIVALVGGIRREDPRASARQSATAANDAESTGATVIARLIDSRGAPVADELLQLWHVLPGEGFPVVAHSQERTDDRGQATFTDLSPEGWYRVEALVSGVAGGASGVFSVRGEQMMMLKPIGVWPRDQRIVHGFVLRAAGPAAYARVRLLEADGPTDLATLTDKSGFFVLGPAKPGTLSLEVQHTDERGRRALLTFPVDRDVEELVIPLDALAAPAPQKN